MALNKQQADALVAEVFDPTKIQLKCTKHLYFGPVHERPEVTPTLGCSECWKIFYIHELAQCPPDKRREKLEEIEEVMHHVVEMVENGTWDFMPYDHAQIEIGQE